MVSTPPSPPDALAAAEAETLLALVDAGGSILDAARQRGLPPADLLALIDRPAARRAMESLRAVAALRRELRADAARDELVNTLRHVARCTPDLIQKRLAATAALRALPVPRPSGGSGRGSGRDGRAASNHAPSTRHAGRQWPPLRGIVPTHRSAPGPNEAVSTPGSTVIHRAHHTPSVDTPPAEDAGPGAQDSGLDSGLTTHSPASSALSAVNSPDDAAIDDELDRELDDADDAADDEAEDAALDAAYPQTLALARRILADAQVNPDAHHPDAIHAAQFLVDLEREHPTTHPP